MLDWESGERTLLEDNDSLGKQSDLKLLVFESSAEKRVHYMHNYIHSRSVTDNNNHIH